MNHDIQGEMVVLKVNPTVYSLPVVYGTAYFFLERMYVVLDGDPDKEIIIKLTPKKKENLDAVAGDFMNELIRFGFQHQQNKETMALRTLLMKRVLLLDDKAAPVYTKKDVEKQTDSLVDTVFK